MKKNLLLLFLSTVSITAFSQAITCAGGAPSLSTFNWSSIAYTSGSGTQTITQTSGGLPTNFTFSYTGNVATFSSFTGLCSNTVSPVNCGSWSQNTGGVSGNGNHLILFVDGPANSTYANSVVTTTIGINRPLTDFRFSIADIDNSYSPSSIDRRDDIRITGFFKGTPVRPVGVQANAPAATYDLDNNFSATTIRALGKPLTAPYPSGDNDNFGTLNVYFNSAIDQIVINYAEANAAPGSNPSIRGVALGNFLYCPSLINLSGNVFNDANGNATVDGGENPINGTNSGGGILPGEPLYANLIGPDGNVWAVAPIQSNGTYNFTNAPQWLDGCTIQLSKNQGTIGNPKPLTELPPAWGSAGENKNGQGGSPDILANGEVPLSTAASNITLQNFGIDRLPDSDPKSYTIAQPALNSTRTLNGSGLQPGPLSGSDPEDGTLGTNGSIAITQLPSNGNQLWYNGIQITTGQDGTNPPSPSNPFIISNYDPALLAIHFTGAGSTTTSFTYSFFDAAGLGDPSSATYTINWAIPLPVELISFTAKAFGNNTVLNWSTENQDNFHHFEIQRSTSGTDPYITIGQVSTNNLLSGEYSFTDVNAALMTNENLYYRLKLVDNDNSYKLSEIAVIRFINNTALTVLPTIANPGENIIVILSDKVGPASAEYELALFNADSKLVLKQKITVGAVTRIETTTLAKGAYFLRIIGSKINLAKKIILQ